MNTSLFATVAAAAMLASCANSPQLEYSDYAGEPVKSFYMDSLDGWSPASKNQVVVWTRLNQAYLVTVNGYCPDLRYANVIGVTSTGNTVDKFEKVLVGRDRCFIREIRPIDTKQMREDRKVLLEQMKRPPATS
jgi:Family of unknown function (DUF6491)